MGESGRREYAHDIFISYSHRLDKVVAAAFQNAVEHFGRPFYRSRDLRTFRDQTDLAASPHLWADIVKALNSSAWLIVMASPEARKSEWVQKEIRWWLEHRGSGTLLFALTAGNIQWDVTSGDFDWAATDALPEEVLRGVFRNEPRWVDLRWLREYSRISPRDGRLVQAVAEFVAPVRACSKADLIGAHLRRQRRFRQVVTSVSMVLAILLVISVTVGVRAVSESHKAAERQLIATSRQLVAEATSIQDSQPDLARQLLVQAYRMSPTAQAAGALIASSAIPDVVRTAGYSNEVAYRSDGELFASVSDDGVTLFDGRSSERISRIDGVGGAQASAVAFGDDVDLLAVGHVDGHVRLWDIEAPHAPKMLGSVRTNNGNVNSVAIDRSSSRLAAITDGAVPYVIDIRDRRNPKVMDSVKGTPLTDINESITISPDGTRMAASYEAGKIRIMRVSDSGRLTVTATEASPSRALSFSPDGQFVVSGGQESASRLWDVSDPARPRQVAMLSAKSSLGIDAVAFSRSGDVLATGAGDGTIQLWDLSDPLRPAQGARLRGHSGSVNSLAFAPDGRTLASAGSDGAARAADGTDQLNGTVRLWRVDGAERSSSRVFLPSGHISEQPFSKDGHVLVAGVPSALWWVDGEAQPSKLTTLTTFNVGGQQVSYHPREKRVAAAVPLKVWDVSNPVEPDELTRTTITDGSETVIFSPDGTLVAVGEEKGIGLWSMPAKGAPRRLAVVPVTGRTKMPVVFLDGGRMLATLAEDDNKVQLVTVTTPSEPRRTATLDLGAARPTALAASGRTLLVGDSYGTVTAWRVDGQARPERLSSSARHNTAVEDLAFHPDGAMAASGGRDGVVRLWDVAQPENLREIAILTAGNGNDWTDGVAFSPDGHTLAIASTTTTQLWEVQPMTIQQRLCAQSEPITREQWAQYLPDRPYDPPCATQGPASWGKP
ncbi:toll/interleukin-1 receptor domain-containing protein [Streptomyces sp. RK62]|uniref:toll/interleukin-1 receptor domain-containing protein n=1 Tax=Streptomyces sp. RK62 TaxID=2824893 RepID=UPI001B38B46F|nr:TIR domain-containing protein [Streptomyces sp. RK62]MBQ0996296.1 TIR domain-containing protein [Streptomyces sp. RK62]